MSNETFSEFWKSILASFIKPLNTASTISPSIMFITNVVGNHDWLNEPQSIKP